MDPHARASPPAIERNGPIACVTLRRLSLLAFPKAIREKDEQKFEISPEAKVALFVSGSSSEGQKTLVSPQKKGGDPLDALRLALVPFAPLDTPRVEPNRPPLG